MGIIIGAGTLVSFRGSTSGQTSTCTGATQASWNYNPNVQRMYQLGSWAPCNQLLLPSQTLNLTFYTPAPGGTLDVTANTSCTNSTISASVFPAGCDVSGNIITGLWFVTGYSYSKNDARQPATESWSLMQYTGDETQNPTYNIRGISEGTITTSYDLSYSMAMTGVVLTGAIGSGITVGYQGSVSAGQVSREDQVFSGVAETVGGGTSIAGKVGSASVSMPFTPIWE